MKLVLISLLFWSSNAFCALNIKAGLWQIDSKMMRDGKEVEAMAQMKKAFANMPPEKRKMMQEMMAKSGAGIGNNGEHLFCYSDAMLKKPQSMATQEAKKCETKLVKNESANMVMEFKCENGSSGTAIWKVLSKDSYSSRFEFKSSKGKISQIEQTGKFVSSDCGNVKPILR